MLELLSTNCFPMKIAIVSSRFADKAGNALEALRVSCQKRLQELGVEFIEFRVAGAFEIPTAVKKVLLTKKFEAVITLGVVVRGETSHYEFVAGNAARKIADLGVEFATPVIFGILTTELTHQAEARGKLGKDYAEAAVEMVKTLHEIEDAKI